MELEGVNDKMRWCCRRKEFREVITQTTVEGSTGPCVSTTTRCTVCFNRHYLMEVPPIYYGINGNNL